MATQLYGFGTGPFGTMPFGTSFASIVAIDRVETVAENRVRLFFNEKPKQQNWGTDGDVHNASHYRYEPVPGTVDRMGQPTRAANVVAVQLVDEFTVDLILDRPMSSFPAQYRLDVEGLREAGTNFPLAPQSFVVLAQFKGIPPLTVDTIVNNRDFANPQTLGAIYDPLPIDGTPTDALLGTYPIDSTGDVAFDEGVASYKKRCIRRLVTRRGAFAHLPSYGVGLPQQVKTLSRPGSREALAIDAEEQLRQEPETVAVSVQVVQHPQQPSVTLFMVRARISIGRTVTFSVPIPV